MDYEVFTNNLKYLIEARGIPSIRQASEYLDMPSATLSRYISGNRVPELAYIVRISQKFGVSIDWLLGLDSKKKDNLTPEAREVAKNYMIASEDDKNVVKAVLKRYER